MYCLHFDCVFGWVGVVLEELLSRGRCCTGGRCCLGGGISLPSPCEQTDAGPNGLAAMLAAQKSVGVAPEVNLRNSQKGLINGRSRISKTVGEGAAPTTEEKVKTYFLTRFLLKTAWNWKKLDRGLVPRAPLSPPMLMFSKNVFKNSLKMFFFKKNHYKCSPYYHVIFLKHPWYSNQTVYRNILCQ